MKFHSCVVVLIAAIAFSACAPNRSILLDKTNDANAVAANKTPEPPPSSPTKMTVAELMHRVAKAPPDAFLFPCDLNAYSADDKTRLLKLRDNWLANEENDRYLVSPSTGCVCPQKCVLIVEDIKAPTSRNSAVLIVENLVGGKYSWLAKNLDLSNTKLSWASSTPEVTFSNADGSRNYSCFIEFNEKKRKYASTCGDGRKVFPPLESR